MNRIEEQITAQWNKEADTPLVSVVCTLYNHVKYVNETISGFLMQETDFPFEIILHDDASTDGTTDIVREYAAQYPHLIIPIIQKENQYSKGGNWGHPKTINPHIRGKYVALCEGDDYWTDPNKLRKQVGYMASHPDCAMTFHAVNYEENGKITKNDRHGSAETDFSPEEIITGGGAFCATSSLCVRTDAYLQYPRFRTMADIGDYPQQILFALLGTVHYFPEIMGVYRYKSAGSWTEKAAKLAGSLQYYQLATNQLRWMTELDCYTDYKYTKLISEELDRVIKDGVYFKKQEITQLEAVYSSASWRLGNFLIQPLHALKTLRNRLRGKTH